MINRNRHGIPQEVIDELHNISGIHNPNVTPELVKLGQESAAKDYERPKMPYEKFSNPTEYPGFEQLPQEEKLKRINFSQYDPANLSPFGTPVIPGSYEQPYARTTANALALSRLPMFSRNPILGIPARIATGAAAGTALSAISPDNIDKINDPNFLMDLAKKNLSANAMIEMATMPVKVPHISGQLNNPTQYARNQVERMRNVYHPAVKEQQRLYGKVIGDIGDEKLTAPQYAEKYLNISPEQYQYFSADVKRSYRRFLSNPIVKNLHQFQSRLGRDAAIARSNPNRVDAYQAMSNARKNINKLLNYELHSMGKNPKYEEIYKKATDLTRDVVEPFQSHPYLEEVISGREKNIQPVALHSALESGVKGKYPSIPSNHLLSQIHKSLNRQLQLSKLSQYAIPAAAGAIAGNPFYPGLGGAAGAAGGGAFGHLVSPKLTELVQTPMLEEAASRLGRAYYPSARTYMTNVLSKPPPKKRKKK